MVSKSKFLAVVLAGLAFVLGGRVLAAEQSEVSTPGAQTARTGSKQKSVKASRQSPTATGKKCSAIQDQNPVSAKSKAPSKTSAIQDQVPVTPKTPFTGAKSQKKTVQTAAPSPKKISGSQAPQTSTSSKPSRKTSAVQDQSPTRPAVKAVTNRQQAQTETESFED